MQGNVVGFNGGIFVSDTRLITVVMALYNPNINWLEEELASIQKQTFQNFQVYIWNDNPQDSRPYEDLFRKYLKDIPFRYFSGKKNLGSNKVFEKLTALTDTSYIAFCDQDDVWLPNKLEVLIGLLQKKDVTLACSDMYVIDENSFVVADSITQIRPRQVIYRGEDIMPHLLAKNFITGCTVMMRTDIAQMALPFPKVFFHDWWLSLIAGLSGTIEVSLQPLMKYRISTENQSKPFANVSCKQDYVSQYIKSYQTLLNRLQNIFLRDNRLSLYNRWADVRMRYFQSPNIQDAVFLWKIRYLSKYTTLFELVLPYLPDKIFSFLVKKIKAGR
ncbi:glycosyltransferase [Mitsuokella sp. AF33-22]|nr:glycosyltransferase [Mitsuokella sp. AF33-22]